MCTFGAAGFTGNPLLGSFQKVMRFPGSWSTCSSIFYTDMGHVFVSGWSLQWLCLPGSVHQCWSVPPLESLLSSSVWCHSDDCLFCSVEVWGINLNPKPIVMTSRTSRQKTLPWQHTLTVRHTSRQTWRSWWLTRYRAVTHVCVKHGRASGSRPWGSHPLLEWIS